MIPLLRSVFVPVCVVSAPWKHSRQPCVVDALGKGHSSFSVFGHFFRPARRAPLLLLPRVHIQYVKCDKCRAAALRNTIRYPCCCQRHIAKQLFPLIINVFVLFCLAIHHSTCMSVCAIISLPGHAASPHGGQDQVHFAKPRLYWQKKCNAKKRRLHS